MSDIKVQKKGKKIITGFLLLAAVGAVILLIALLSGMLTISIEVMTALMVIFLLIGLFMGHPLAFVIGGVGVIFGFIGWGPEAMPNLVNRLYSVMDNYILVAAPLFIMMAQLLDRSGIAEDLFGTMRIMFKSVRGGLAVAVVAVSTLFAACTGIIGASVVTMGVLSLPLMLKHKYDKRLACGVICSGGSLGILIPPSIMLVIMADQAAISVGQLFAGAIIPGLIFSTLYIVYCLVICYIKPEMGPALSAEELESIDNKKIMGLFFKSLIPPIVLILGVLGSIFVGIATPTEASGVGCILAFIMMCAYGKFSWKALYEAVLQTAKTTSMVMLIIVAANIFTSVFLGMGCGEVVSDMILGIGGGKWGTFVVMMLVIFVMGMFIDWMGIVLIIFPIFIPIANQLGFDTFWFVMIMALMLQTSFLTPPFGYSLFYLRGIAPPEIKTSDIYWGVMPFCILMIVALVICVVIPGTITWLPTVLVNS